MFIVMHICCCAIGCQHSTFSRLFACVFLVWCHHLRKVNKSSVSTFRHLFHNFLIFDVPQYSNVVDYIKDIWPAIYFSNQKNHCIPSLRKQTTTTVCTRTHTKVHAKRRDGSYREPLRNISLKNGDKLISELWNSRSAAENGRTPRWRRRSLEACVEGLQITQSVVLSDKVPVFDSITTYHILDDSSYSEYLRHATLKSVTVINARQICYFVTVRKRISGNFVACRTVMYSRATCKFTRSTTSGMWVQITSKISKTEQTFLVMVALCNRSDHYIFALWFLSFFLLSFFISSPNLSGHTLDVYHTSTHGVALVWI